MFLEIILLTLLGTGLGIATGLIPGLHPNTIFVLMLSTLPFLLVFPIPAVLAFIVSLSVCNTLTDFIPSILFGAPDPSTALVVLPGHQLLMEGRGYEALALTVVGGIGVMLLTILFLPFMLTGLPALYFIIKPYLHFLLIFVIIWLIFSEKRKLAALFIFLLAGLFGFISLNSLPSNLSLFPALTGLFGLSGLLTSLLVKTKIPKQDVNTKTEVSIRGVVTGWFAGLLAGLLPGLGSSQAGVIAGKFLKAKPRDFITALGGINTANILFTFMVFFTLGKTRSGAIWITSQIVTSLDMNTLFVVVLVGLATTLISAIITLKLGKIISKRISDINYNKMTWIVIISLFVLIFIFTGPIGILISIIGMLIGLATIFLNINRSHMMGFLIFPTIMYFSGLNPLLLFGLNL